MKRPPENNGIGIHLGLNLNQHGIESDLAHCKEMGMKWVLVCHSDRDILVRTAKRFWGEGIMPVIRPYRLINKPGAGWADLTKRLADALGFSPYIQIYNEPSGDREWKNNDRPNDWLEFFAGTPTRTGKWHRVANTVAMAGGLPGLQVLDTKELRAVLQFGFHEKGWFCPHNYGCKLPPDYYVKGDGKSIGVLSFLDFADVFEEVIDRIPPFICGEGGWFFGSIGDQQHADWTTEMYGWFRKGYMMVPELDGGLSAMELPDYLYAVCPWILRGRGFEPWHGYCTATKTIEAVKGMSDFVRGDNGGEVRRMTQRLEFEWDEETPRVVVLCEPLGVATSGKDIAEAFEMIGDACAVYWRTLKGLGERND